jgi:hypothetical protein
LRDTACGAYTIGPILYLLYGCECGNAPASANWKTATLS